MSPMTQPHTPALTSRLPHVGTTIFTVMSALAAETGAVNLGQGFPDFDCDPELVNAVTRAMQAGHNQYPPMPGVPALRQAMAAKMLALYGLACDPNTEITVTAGATQAILTAILAVVHPGDEVIVLEPCYDSYVPNIELAGGVAVRVPLTPGSFRPDFGAIAAAITPRTRAIIVNSPHNPSGQVWSQADMLPLQDPRWPPPARRTWSCRPSTSASATCSARVWPAPVSPCCPVRAPTSSAWASATWRYPSATCPKATSASGSRARSASRPSRSRLSTATDSTRRWCASVLRRRTTPCAKRSSASRGSDPESGDPGACHTAQQRTALRQKRSSSRTVLRAATAWRALGPPSRLSFLSYFLKKSSNSSPPSVPVAVRVSALASCSSSPAHSGCSAGPPSTCAPRAGSYWLWSAQQWIRSLPLLGVNGLSAAPLRKLMKLRSR